MSYSFLLVSGKANTVTIPVGSASNGQTAVLNRKGSSISSTGVIANGKATFDIPIERVVEFAGNYSVTVSGSVIQNGDIDIIPGASAGNGGGGTGNVDLSSYPTKAQLSSTVNSAVSSKAEKTYVDAQLSLKATASDLKSVALSGDYSDLAGKPDLNAFATTTALANGLAGKVNSSTYTTGLSAKADAETVYTKTEVDAAVNAKANAADVYPKSVADTKFALAGAGAGNTLTAIQTSTGYALLDGTPVTSRVNGFAYNFRGLSDPPFIGNGDEWKKVDLGILPPWTLISSDGFDDGKNLATPADVALKAKWRGMTANFTQGSTGTLKPLSWSGSVSQNYLIVDSTVLAKRMAAEITATAYANTTSRRAFALLLNTDMSSVDAATVNGYSVGMSTDGVTMTWTCFRRDAGTATQIAETWSEPYVATPMTYRAESNGKGTLTLYRNNAAVKSWTDPAATPLTGTLAGLINFHSSGSSTTASMAIRADDWKAYAG